MNNTVISIEHLSKAYRLGQIGTGRLIDDVKVWWAKRAGKPNPLQKIGETDRGNREGETIWALKDVSFDANAGEVLGIIGRNGAGKSTLLKILSNVTAPTSGQVNIRGRIASLLEVGTGFHPDLTGRENVYLNGAILGMNRREIARKFDEIVTFAEIEQFIDTPVKRYSSGMYVRLAFAVAAHLDPEILIIDEVLAVGDAAFQRKCLGKMEDIGKGGRTILFVSHNMTAIRSLCTLSYWLDAGNLRKCGPTDEVVSAYLQANFPDTNSDLQSIIQSLPPDPTFRLISVEIAQGGKKSTMVMNGEPVEILINYQILESVLGFRVYIDLVDNEKNILVRTFHDDTLPEINIIQPGFYRSIAIIPANFLAPMEYELHIQAGIHGIRNCAGDGVRLRLSTQSNTLINRAYPGDQIRSKLQPLIRWSTKNTK